MRIIQKKYEKSAYSPVKTCKYAPFVNKYSFYDDIVLVSGGGDADVDDLALAEFSFDDGAV